MTEGLKKDCMKEELRELQAELQQPAASIPEDITQEELASLIEKARTDFGRKSLDFLCEAWVPPRWEQR